MGFCRGGDSVSLSSADTGSSNRQDRLSWHLTSSGGGYRAGGLTGDEAKPYHKCILGFKMGPVFGVKDASCANAGHPGYLDPLDERSPQRSEQGSCTDASILATVSSIRISLVVAKGMLFSNTGNFLSITLRVPSSGRP